MKKWMKKMAIIGAILFVGGIDKYNWGDSEEIWDDTEQLPEEIDEPDEMEEQLDIEKQCE